jgi:hypothetical protein
METHDEEAATAAPEREAIDLALSIVRAARPVSRGDDDSVVAAAMLAGASRHRAYVRARIAVATSGVLLAAAAAFLLSLPPGPPPAQAPELLAMELPTGDAVSAVAGASFRVESSAPELRRLRLDRGAMLFDVRPLAGGERFEVATADATVSVVGTVFAIEAGERGTTVVCFEGRVHVADRDGETVLAAGERFHGDRTGGALALLEPAGELAAARRAEIALAPPLEAVPAVLSADPAAGAAVADVLAAAERIERAPVREVVEPADPAVVRAWIAEGRPEDALAAARAETGGAWRFVEADALRGLRRFAEAADAYDAAAASLDGAQRVQAGYLAATVRATELRDPSGALASLDAASADGPGSLLRERAMVLRATALADLGRTEEVRTIAADYLESFPEGSRAAWMRSHL